MKAILHVIVKLAKTALKINEQPSKNVFFEHALRKKVGTIHQIGLLESIDINIVHEQSMVLPTGVLVTDIWMDPRGPFIW